MKTTLWKNQKGHVAVTFALLGIPVALAGTLALDSYSANDEQGKLQAALDSAVLATVSNGYLAPEDREDYARQRFASNFQDDAVLTFSDDGEVVSMTAKAEVDTILGGIINKDTIEIFADSAGTVNKGQTICVLALDESGEGAVTFEESAYFRATNCSVHVNSSNLQALKNMSTGVPTAENFCANGGAVGGFEPSANTECDKVDDPYVDLAIPAPSNCIEDSELRQAAIRAGGRSGLATMTTTVDMYGTGTLTNTTTMPGNGNGNAFGQNGAPGQNGNNGNGGNGGNGGAGGTGATGGTVISSGTGGENETAVAGSNTVLMPGTYCDSLVVDGVGVYFNPGVYHFLRGVTFKNSAEAYARDVTFVLQGDKSQINIETGAELYLKAPATGDMAGLVIVQSGTTYSRYGGVEPASRWLYNLILGEPVSYLSSGGRLNVVGTVYLPDQHLEVSGNSVFGAQARSTSFIAKSVRFTGTNHTTLAVDHVAEGLPPIEPRIETAPRLIK